MKKSHYCLKAMTLLVALGFSQQAHADVSQTYDSHRCFPAVRSFRDKWVPPQAAEPSPIDYAAAGQISNVSDSLVSVVCPIELKGGGPTVFNDYIKSATVPIYAPAQPITCTIRHWHSSVPVDEDGIYSSNFVTDSGPYSARSSHGGNSIVTFPELPWMPVSWQQQYAPQDWLYMDMKCDLPASTILKNYTVTESGVDTGYRINPGASCAPDGSNNMNLHYWDDTSTTGGMVVGQATGGATKYALKCPVPNNGRVDVAVGPAANSPMGCNLDNANLTTLQWASLTNPGVRSWPSQMLPLSTQPFIAVPATGAHNLICGVNASSGDGKLLSYRSAPPQNRSAWAVSASLPQPNNSDVDANPVNVKDNLGGKRWTTKTAGLSGQWFKVDFGSPKTWSQVTMDSGNSTNDYARGYRIETSNDGNTWTSAATGTGTWSLVTKKLTTSKTSRYVRIVLTQPIPNGWWWSIDELQIY